MSGRSGTGPGSVLEREHWEIQYQNPSLPWETNRPSTELRRAWQQHHLIPGRALELGCGTGINAVWLAEQGCSVTAIDLSPLAIRRARQRARKKGMKVEFLTGNLLEVKISASPFDFFRDRGCYGALRRVQGPGYLRVVERLTRPGSIGLVLTGNAAEPEEEAGPPVLSEKELREDWSPHFEILQLRPFRWDAPRPGDRRYLGWACLLQRKDVDSKNSENGK